MGNTQGWFERFRRRLAAWMTSGLKRHWTDPYSKEDVKEFYGSINQDRMRYDREARLYNSELYVLHDLMVQADNEKIARRAREIDSGKIKPKPSKNKK